MKFCLYLPPFEPFSDARVLARLASEAEQVGWDGFFIWDHISGERYPEKMVDPWVALALIAENTKKIRIGALVTPLARRRPWKVARETVSIDQISEGRLIFGVGTGSEVGEFDNLGEESDPSKRGEMLDEGLELLKTFWSGETVNYSGNYYQVNDTRFLPKPVREPGIPIWAAGIWPNKKPFRRGAKLDGIFPLFPSAKDDKDMAAQLKDMVEYTHKFRDPQKPFDIVFRGFKLPLDDPSYTQELLHPYKELGVTWWQTSLSPREFGGNLKDKIWPLQQMEDVILQGPPKLE
ncbi:MAG: LLM class flavin-dependent oxidoreductase [Anaerolineales bacterium]|nr:LLM class flavin-dependent oxidoreductase [Anaerolineales bacterium]